MRMGYFKGLAAGNFHKDADGRNLFFPYGVFARGRVLPDEHLERRVRAFVTRYHVISLVGIVVFVSFFRWIWLVPFVAFLAVWYYVEARVLVGGCAYSADKLSLRDSVANSAAAHNAVTLWLMLAGSLLFVATGAYMAFQSAEPVDRAFGIGGAIFFAIGGAIAAWMLKLRSSPRR
jgi:hypothetical protein